MSSKSLLVFHNKFHSNIDSFGYPWALRKNSFVKQINNSMYLRQEYIQVRISFNKDKPKVGAFPQVSICY